MLLYERFNLMMLIFLPFHIQNKPIYAEQEEENIMIVKTEYIINTYKFI